jgi:glucosamine-6-phosphate deaminase
MAKTTFTYRGNNLKISVHLSKDDLGRKSAETAAVKIREAIAAKGESNIILATGASQFDTISHLIKEKGIDWSKVTVFHLDEYIGLPDTHPASFRKYLKERFADKIPNLKKFHYVMGDAENPAEECARLDELISKVTIDVACIGIGENGHIAFNDPPADFESEKPYIIVDLDEACRRQQMGEGWFPTLADVPSRAISMGVKQIMKSKCLVVAVPDQRKAEAVKNTVEEPVSPNVPATILKRHNDCTLFIDQPAASKLSDPGIAEANA